MTFKKALACLGALSAAPALAQDAREETNVDLIIQLGFGGRVQPSYEGSDDYEVSPFPVIGFGYLSLPGLFTLGSLEQQSGGFSVGPAFN